MRNKNYNKPLSGFIIIEVLLAMVILSMIFISLFSTLSFLTNRTERSKFDSQAAALMQEGIEVSRNSLLSSWTELTAGDYYPLFDADTNRWTLKRGEEGVLQGKFTRKVTISNVCRGAQGIQTPCPGNVDSYSRLVTATISWKEVQNDKTVTAQLLVYRIKS